MRVGAGVPEEKKGSGRGVLPGWWRLHGRLGFYERCGVLPGFGWLFSFPAPGKSQRIIFMSRWLREQWFFTCCSIKCRCVWDRGVSLCGQWLSWELGLLWSCLAQGGETLSLPHPHWSRAPSRRAPSTQEYQQKAKIFAKKPHYSNHQLLGSPPKSYFLGSRVQRMVPVQDEHLPWWWQMPHVVTVKDTSQGLSPFLCGTGFFNLKFYEYNFSCRYSMQSYLQDTLIRPKDFLISGKCGCWHWWDAQP